VIQRVNDDASLRTGGTAQMSIKS